jgi:hypothetical protein
MKSITEARRKAILKVAISGVTRGRQRRKADTKRRADAAPEA